MEPSRQTDRHDEAKSFQDFVNATNNHHYWLPPPPHHTVSLTLWNLPTGRRIGIEIQLYAFFISALHADAWSVLHARRSSFCTDWRAGWMGSRVRLNTVRESVALTGDRKQIPRSSSTEYISYCLLRSGTERQQAVHQVFVAGSIFRPLEWPHALLTCQNVTLPLSTPLKQAYWWRRGTAPLIIFGTCRRVIKRHASAAFSPSKNPSITQKLTGPLNRSGRFGIKKISCPPGTGGGGGSLSAATRTPP